MADRLLGNAPAPTKVAVLDPKTGLLAQQWRDYFERMTPTLEAIPSRLNFIALSDQTGSIGATDFSNGSLLLGQYRLSYDFLLKSTSGGGSLRVTFRWTSDGLACSFQGFALNLGVTETFGTMGENVTVRSDKGTPITYETAFSGASAYNLDVTLEKVAIL